MQQYQTPTKTFKIKLHQIVMALALILIAQVGAYIQSKIAHNNIINSDANISTASLINLSTEPASVMQFNDCLYNLYELFELEKYQLQESVFRQAITGYVNLRQQGQLKNPDILTLIDFTKPSTERRLYMLDMKNHRVIRHSLVAHGKNSGNNYANSFSNTVSSLQSSLGFYVTGGTYEGEHGYSLYLNGMEPGINDNARERAIVMHAAKYVCEEYIQKHGRLGRSWGCPAVSTNEHEAIISNIKNGSCLFIYHNDTRYSHKSRYLDKNRAANWLMAQPQGCALL